jgi:cell division protein ZapA (FtsZ GTPase activity inhibitor)
MGKNHLRIEVLGTVIPIAAEEELSYLNELYEYYRQMLENTKKASGFIDPLKIAVLTGFLLCDEVKKMTEVKLLTEAEEAEEAEERTKNILSLLDNFIKNA